MQATRVRDVAAMLRELCPPTLAEDWDNVGLLVGDADAELERVMTCLTLTPPVAAEAIAEHVQLIVSHHPVLFRAVRRLTTETPDGRMLLDLIAAGVSIYSPHTGFDSAAGGINDQLAAILGLADVRPLRPSPSEQRYKLVVFVPEPDREPVAQALFDAGAGAIGEYRECSFRTPGTGTFFGSEGTRPAVGQKGRREEVAEERLEVVCPKSRLADVLARLRDAHPYEEPAIDVYPLWSEPGTVGAGRQGTLAKPTAVNKLAAGLKKSLGAAQVAIAGDGKRTVTRVAVACGSGGEFLDDAVRAGCEVLVTGEARFHTYLEAQARDVALLLPGHYASERFAVQRLAERIAERFDALTVWPSREERDPLAWV